MRTTGSLGVLAFLFLTGSANAQTDHAKVVVVMTDEGALDQWTAAALTEVTAHRLVESGLQVVELPALKGQHALDGTLGAKVREAGATRLFVIHVLRMYYKLILVVDERDLDGQVVLASASMPGSIDECDVILPRLVDAVLARQPVTRTALYGNTVSAEPVPVKKRTGEHCFVLGLPLGLSNNGNSGGVGLSLGYLYETERYAVGLTGLLAGGSNNLIGLFDMHALYYFLPGGWSPYAGVGLGYMGVVNSTTSGDGAGAAGELGVEFMRFTPFTSR